MARKYNSPGTLPSALKYSQEKIWYGGWCTKYTYPKHILAERSNWKQVDIVEQSSISARRNRTKTGRDEFRWNLDQSGVFSVKSHYPGLIHQDTPNLNKKLWKLKTPLKTKIFLWYLKRGVILTKDNLVRRNWQGNQQRCFCHKNETIQHLFSTAESHEWYGFRSIRPGHTQTSQHVQYILEMAKWNT